MRACLSALIILTALVPALADPAAKAPARHAGAPSFMEKIGQWTVATHAEGDAKTCYVFTRAEASPQHIVGRGDVVLSVTRRPGRHDVVAVSAGFMLSGHEDAPLQAGSTRMLFYIAGRSAFAHDNAAAIATFGHESSVVAHLAGPRGLSATDHFSLQGFAGAYEALGKACPAS
jgi:invasion protein IalB